MSIYGSLFSLMIITGCAATMVNNPGSSSSSQYAPTNEASRGGVVKYVNQGADFILKARREDAYKQMYDACNGKYKIDAEGQKTEGGFVQAMGNGAAYSSDNLYWYIQFSCEKKETT